VSFPPELQATAARNAPAAALLAAQRNIYETRQEVFESQLAIIDQKKSEIMEEIQGLKAQATAAAQRSTIVSEELEMVAALVEKGLERRPRLLNLQREMADVEGRRGEIAAQISRAEQVINESNATRYKLERDRQNDIAQSLREAQNQKFQLREKLLAAEDQLSRTQVKAPEDGVVTELRIHTPGGVIAAGAALLDLVPRQDRLIVAARVRPEDIDVVYAGLQAEVQLLPYNQRRVPRLKGRVMQVSADRLVDKRTDQPYYSTKIRVEDPQIGEQHIKIIPGMPAQVFIKTGHTTVALYALRPLIDSFHTAFHED
jgi:HlyD family secretion protein